MTDLGWAFRPIWANEIKLLLEFMEEKLLLFPTEFKTKKIGLGGIVVILYLPEVFWDKVSMEKSGAWNQRYWVLVTIIWTTDNSCLKNVVWIIENRWRNQGSEPSSWSQSISKNNMLPLCKWWLKSYTLEDSPDGEPSFSSMIFYFLIIKNHVWLIL